MKSKGWMAACALAMLTVTSAWAQVPVGASTLQLPDSGRARAIKAEVWYPAAQGSRTQELAAGFLPFTVARDAAPAAGGRLHPLVVISHGNRGTRYAHSWLASSLVSAGFVVLSAEHPGTSVDDATTVGRVQLWQRSRDVTWALDEVLKDPRWSALVDRTRIGFAGHSFGGWTGVSLAGGEWNPGLLLDHCARLTSADSYCESLKAEEARQVSLAGASASYRDERIKAFYLMGTGPGAGFTPASLKAITTPMVFDTAEFDEILAPTGNSTHLAKGIPGAREVVRQIGHFTYLPKCSPTVGAPGSTRAAGIRICDDPQGVDREDAHRTVAADAIRFFSEALAYRPVAALQDGRR